jgi:hypothetical protein
VGSIPTVSTANRSVGRWARRGRRAGIEIRFLDSGDQHQPRSGGLASTAACGPRSGPASTPHSVDHGGVMRTVLSSPFASAESTEPLKSIESNESYQPTSDP